LFNKLNNKKKTSYFLFFLNFVQYQVLNFDLNEIEKQLLKILL